jgi:hypothetical protein
VLNGNKINDNFISNQSKYIFIDSNNKNNLHLYEYNGQLGGKKQKSNRKSKRNYSKKQRKQSKNDTLRNYFNYAN